LDEGLTTPHPEKPACYEMLCRALDLLGSCECGNEPLAFIKDGEFLE